jgi:hypothetical protein
MAIERLPKEINEAALKLRAWLGNQHGWYPLFALLGDLAEGRDMRPTILKDPFNNLWRIQLEDGSERMAPTPPPFKDLPMSVFYPAAGTVH